MESFSSNLVWLIIAFVIMAFSIVPSLNEPPSALIIPEIKVSLATKCPLCVTENGAVA
nr:MAG TPA: hypothetical protein [Bacteriophage sp.]